MTTSALTRILLIGGGIVGLVAVILISWQLGRDDASTPTTAASAAMATASQATPVASAVTAPKPGVASAPVAIRPTTPALKPQTTTAVIADAPEILKEIPAARPICAGLARHDAMQCSHIEHSLGAANYQACQESARARLESCNAGQGGLPPLTYAH